MNVGAVFGETLTTTNPPVHTRYRKVFQHAFLSHIASKWGNTIVTPVVNGLIDKFAGRGHADLVGEFARLYPFQVIFRQLDLPIGDQATFHKLAAAQSNVINAFMAYAVEAAQNLGYTSPN